LNKDKPHDNPRLFWIIQLYQKTLRQFMI
jgi:hypothetical protein